MQLFENISETSTLEILMNTNIEELDEHEAVEFCKLIESGNKAIINQFSYLVSRTENIHIADALVQYCDSDESFVRNLSGEILINLGSFALDPLLNNLDNGDKHKKKFIIDVLGLIGDKKASEKIMRMLKTSTDENVILACVEALGNIEEERSVALLINLYNANELFIPSIIEALGKIGSNAAIEFITSAYSTDDDLIKYSIIECLGNVGSAKSFYFLISELNKLEGPKAWAAVEAIYKLSQKYNLEVPFEENFKNIVLNTLYEADSQFQKAALFLVISYDDPEIFQAYLSVLGSDYEINEIVKDKLFNNINATLQGVRKRLQSKSKNIPDLLSLLEEMCDMHGIVFADELSRLEIEQFIDALAETLESPHEEARKSAMNLMFKIDADSAMLFIDKMLEDDNLWNKLALIDILEEMELKPDTLKILSEYYESADEMMKERISYLIESNNKQLSE